MLAKSLALCVAVLGAVALVHADPKLAYPKCATEDTSKCCELTKSEHMAHHGYFLASLNGNATVVTCKAGTLECHLGNPGQSATNGEYAKVDCPRTYISSFSLVRKKEKENSRLLFLV
jgi:hypothetical protein